MKRNFASLFKKIYTQIDILGRRKFDGVPFSPGVGTGGVTAGDSEFDCRAEKRLVTFA